MSSSLWQLSVTVVLLITQTLSFLQAIDDDEGFNAEVTYSLKPVEDYKK